jgi:uncharacterized membrane protein YhiD involved in acid resistance
MVRAAFNHGKVGLRTYRFVAVGRASFVVLLDGSLGFCLASNDETIVPC